MDWKVVWSSPALLDLEEIYEFISRDSKKYADALVSQIIKKTERLKVFPQSGRVLQEINDPRFREVIIGSYRVLYEIGNGEVVIGAVVHGKRSLEFEQ